MNTVALYIKDFQKGTIISDRLIAMDLSVEFIDKHNLFSNNYILGIVDLDDEEFGRKEFIKDFLINKNKATAKQIEDLGKLIIEKVHKKFGILLEWEIKIIGEYS